MAGKNRRKKARTRTAASNDDTLTGQRRLNALLQHLQRDRMRSTESAAARFQLGATHILEIPVRFNRYAKFVVLQKYGAPAKTKREFRKKIGARLPL